jgi:hypothetical protein
MSAATLYEAIHETIAEQVQIDDPLSTFELLGVIEQVKYDVLLAGDDDDDDILDAAEA